MLNRLPLRIFLSIALVGLLAGCQSTKPKRFAPEQAAVISPSGKIHWLVDAGYRDVLETKTDINPTNQWKQIDGPYQIEFDNLSVMLYSVPVNMSDDKRFFRIRREQGNPWVVAENRK